MSKKRRHPSPIVTPIGVVNVTPVSEPELTEAEMETAIESAIVGHGELVPKHRQCPICWGTNQGLGVCQHTERRTDGAVRSYKCTKSAVDGNVGCNFTWTATLKHHQITIDWQEVILHTRGVQ